MGQSTHSNIYPSISSLEIIEIYFQFHVSIRVEGNSDSIFMLNSLPSHKGLFWSGEMVTGISGSLETSYSNTLPSHGILLKFPRSKICKHKMSSAHEAAL
jgi:hypothetical protein